MPAASLPLILGLSAAGQAASTIYGAKKSGDAAKDATAAQLAAGQKGINALEQSYQQGRSDFAPYLRSGQQAVSTLGALLNPNQPYRPGSVPPPAPAPVTQGGGLVPGMNGVGPLGTANQPLSNQPTLGQLGSPGNLTGRGLVTVQGPDGSTTQMPALQAEQYRTRPGFKVLA